MIDPFGSTILGARAGFVALDVALKAAALIILVFAGHGLLGRRRAAARSALWNACLVGLLLLPAASLAAPRLRLALPDWVGPAPVLVPAPTVDVPHAAIDRPRTDTADGAVATGRGPVVRPAMNRVVDPIGDVVASGSIARPEPAGRSAADAPAIAVVAPSPRVQVGGVDLALGVFMMVAAWLGIRLIVSMAAVGRLRRDGEPIGDPRWAEALDRWRARLGVGRSVMMLETDAVSIPVVVGWVRPAIIVPRGLAGAANPSVIDAVLLHELGHVRRGDFGWNLLWRLAHVVYWPHPLIWPIGRVIGAVREQACDDLCVHGLGGAEPYRESLLEVAGGLIRRPGPALGLAMARGTNLGRRLAWIDRTRGASRCVLRWPARAAIAIVLTVAAGVLGAVELSRAAVKAAEPPASAPAPTATPTIAEPPTSAPTPTAPRTIDIIVRGKDTGKPIEGATVRAHIAMEQVTRKTDRDGKVRFILFQHKSRDNLSLDVWAEGYVQQRYFFSQNDARQPKIPEQFAVSLLPGEQTLGGTVNDERGRPIKGVKVAIWAYLGEKKQKEELAWMVDATTDDQGRWRCRCFRNVTFAYLYLSHPDYLSDGDAHPRAHGQPTRSAKAAAENRALQALRDFSDVQVMTRGVEVSGEIRDHQGKPVPDAEVGWIEPDRNQATFHSEVPITTTDERGRFRFPHARPGRLVLQVLAKGHAPELTPVAAAAGMPPVAILLGPARRLEGRVVDSQGRPIAEAFVVIDTWRTFRSLGVFLWSDADGRFAWNDAPADRVLINASHTGYSGVHWRPATAGDAIVLTLKRSVSISGRVRDAATGKAIDEAEVDVGVADAKTGEVRWGKGEQTFATQGYLQASVDAERSSEFRLRIQANGYEPFESRVFRSDEGQVEYDVSLKKTDKPQGTVVSGVVVRPDGKPLAGAEVAITYPMTGGRDGLFSVHIEDGKIQPIRGMAYVKTDASGRFTLGRKPDPAGRYFAVVVVHPAFYAEVGRAPFEADPTIRAKPWGRVEGVARVGGKAASGAAIRYFGDRLGNADVPYVMDSGNAQADDQGRFVLDHVVPGEVRVSRQFVQGKEPTGWSNGVLVDVKPGETTRAEIGGTGRPVVARIARPPGFDPKADYAAHSEFEIESDRPHIPYSKELLAKRDNSMIVWAKRWWASGEGREYRRHFFRFGQAKLQPDGTIRVDDVPPGSYRLNLTYSADPVRGLGVSPDRIAHFTKQFTIPEIPGGRDDQPFDLGVLRPGLKRTLRVGQPAPAFEVETLDGRRVKLADFRGKYLLLDFWATWCGPCVAEIPELKAVHDRFGKDPRFAMISLSVDAEKEAPRKFVKEKGIAWTQGFVGEWAEGGVSDAYHAETIPAMFLIGPDGTLKSVGLRGEAVAGVIGELLKQP